MLARFGGSVTIGGVRIATVTAMHSNGLDPDYVAYLSRDTGIAADQERVVRNHYQEVHGRVLTARMARNIEIKARIGSVEALVPAVAALASGGPFAIAQDDTFFRCATGRLKLRDFLDGSGELIFYRRADEAGPKESFYLRSPTSDPAGLRQAMTLACDAAGRVVKHRILFLVGRTRVHLDRVEGLGDFLELEVVLADNESPDAGVREAEALMARLGIGPCQLIEGAYVELLRGPGSPTEPERGAALSERSS